jgi:hypothetical protein
MSAFEIGQRVDIDVFGLLPLGARPTLAQATGTVIAAEEGGITVRLDLDGGPAEVHVSAIRVIGRRDR